MSKEKQSLEKLVKIFEEEKRYKTDMFFRNAFATACYLSLQGEDVAAQKILTTLFDWLGWDRRKTYFLNNWGQSKAKCLTWRSTGARA